MYLDILGQYIVVLLQYACHISQYIVVRLWHIVTALLNRYLAENDRKKLNYMRRYVPDGKGEMSMQLHLEIVSKYIRTGVKSKLTP